MTLTTACLPGTCQPAEITHRHCSSSLGSVQRTKVNSTISPGLLQLLDCMTLELCLIEEHVRLQALLVPVAVHGMLPPPQFGQAAV